MSASTSEGLVFDIPILQLHLCQYLARSLALHFHYLIPYSAFSATTCLAPIYIHASQHRTANIYHFPLHNSRMTIAQWVARD
jgi:hypothetical protein